MIGRRRRGAASPAHRPFAALGVVDDAVAALTVALFALVALAVVLLAASGCRGAAPGAEAFSGSSMGTTYHVKVVEPGLADDRRAELDAAIAAALDDVDAAMSTYRADSEVSRFNAAATTEPFAVSAATATVVAEAQRVSRLTGGAFDVTVGPLVDAWGFGPGLDPAAEPSADELAALRARVGWEKLALDAGVSAASTSVASLVKSAPDLHVDLSAIAKGYAVDRVAEALAARGVDRYMVEVGGEVRTAGTNSEGQVWRIGIERPVVDGRALQRVVPLADAALATSGDYRNFREVGGERFSHIIDPRTGRPARHRLASVSVVTERCATADALATALMVLGPDDGFELATREDLAVFFLVHDGEGDFLERSTPAFAALAGAPLERSP